MENTSVLVPGKHQICQVLKNIMRETGPRISRLAPNAQMWPSAKGASFLKGSGGKLPKKFYIFILENAICGTLKQ